MKREKVYINGRFLTQRVTGVQRYAHELLRALDKHLGDASHIDAEIRPEFILVVPRAFDGMLPIFDHIKLVVAGRFSGQLWEQLELPFLTRGGLLVNLCNTAPIFKKRKIVSLHDAAVFSHASAYSRTFVIWYKLLFKHLALTHTPIISVSDFAKNELVSLARFSADDIKVIYHGHEHLENIPAETGIFDKLGLTGKRFALAVSSDNPTKNFGSIALALKKIENPDFYVVIAGGQNKKVFSTTLGARWPTFVLVTGYVTDGELRALYERTSCFIFPSIYEGFGLPPLEALACGAPVLGSDIPVLREIFGAAITYCDAENPDDIASKLQQIMTNPVRNETGVRTTLANLTWEKCADETLTYIRKHLDQ